jgi:hypothetical protein
VPEGFGQEWDVQATLTVKDRALALPDGRPCRPGEAACAAALQALRGKRLALELDSASRMAELSAPLSTLTSALEDGELVCLAVADSKGRRCVPFRPFSGEDFGEWLDADKPLGKLRVVMRTDGLEVVTDRGKVPGPDRYGPSLPSLGGKPDYPGLENAARRLADRFPDEDTAGLAPSPSIPVGQVARVLAALSGPEGRRFPRTFLVYP